MIESDSFSYEMTKFFLGMFVYFAFPGWIVLLIYFAIDQNSKELLLPLGYVILFYSAFIYVFKKSKTHYYLAKMDEKLIKLKKDGEAEIEILWEEVSALERVPLITPPLYFIKSSKLNKTVVFPTSSYLKNLTIAIGWLVIIRDFSRMGKHIRKMKRERNVQSLYKTKTISILENFKK
jgi:hypothetical protein